MRIVENTPERMVLRYYSWRIWAVTLTAALIANLTLTAPSTNSAPLSELIGPALATIIPVVMAVAILFHWIRYNEVTLERGANSLRIRQLYFFI